MSKKVVIAYATNRGNAKLVAEKLSEKISGSNVLNMAEASVSDLKGYDYLILGTSSTGHGDIQKPWKDKADELAAIDFTGKTVALFGLGNSKYHADSFAGGVSHLFDALNGKVAIEGATSTEGYKFETSNSVVDGKFVGLIIDQDNESDKTDDRIDAWLKNIEYLTNTSIKTCLYGTIQQVQSACC